MIQLVEWRFFRLLIFYFLDIFPKQQYHRNDETEKDLWKGTRSSSSDNETLITGRVIKSKIILKALSSAS